MEKIPNIQATKEYQFAKEVENMLNNYSFNHSVFAASIPFMHPTIQQLLYRLIRKCLKVMAGTKNADTMTVTGLRTKRLKQL